MKTDKQQLDELCKITEKLINGFFTQHNIRCFMINNRCSCGRDNLLKRARKIIEANK